MFFDNWYSLWRIVVITVISYVVLTAVVRITGKRTISKMSAFDFIITIALGSTLATVILSKDVSLSEGITAFVMLCALQYVTSLIFVKFPKVEEFVKAQPTLLLYQQQYQRDAMRRVRVSEMDIIGAIRSHGRHWQEVEAVVLEIDGSLAVIPKSDASPAEKILEDVKPKPPELSGDE